MTSVPAKRNSFTPWDQLSCFPASLSPTTASVPCFGQRARVSRVPSIQSSRNAQDLSAPGSLATQASCPLTLVRVQPVSPPAAAEYRVLALVSGPGHRGFLGPRIGRREGQAFVQEVRSPAELDADRAADESAVLSARTRSRARPGVATGPSFFAAFGAGSLARPGVVALGRDVNRLRLGRGRRRHEGSDAGGYGPDHEAS